MKSLLLLLLHLGIYLSMYSQTLTLNPSYQSIGICITDIGNADSCKIEYKKQSSTKWVTGFSPDKIILSGSSQFRGSLFLLEESTKYDVQLTIYTTGIASKLPISTTSTLSSPNFKAGNNIKWVSPNGKGNLYTEENPGNITTLFSSGLVECGTTIFLTNGVFTQNGLNLNITTNCTEATPICIMAAPGAKPIVDGGISTALVWKQHPSDSKLFSAAIPSTAAYSTLCILDNAALYAYPSLTPKTFLGGYNLSALNFGYDGFVRDGNTIWIKTNAGINPNTSSVTLSTAFCFLTVYGKNNNAYLKVKGIEFKHFGKPILNAGGAYSATVFDIRNAHFVYFDSCKFLYNTSNISFSSQCNNLFIQNSTFKHDVGKWSHAMIKKSLFYVHNFLNSIATSRGRAIEEAAIFSDLGKNITVRYNIFDGMNSGIAGSYDRGLNEDVDIYENTFVDNFDAIECDGYWTNLRVWKNEIIRPMAGISAAP
ncbi:MAG: hypothetical protein KA319_03295, partial [Ferruginibacter sp.]|nr:hypothetical protein [Ferruginibacter sp.]